MLGRDRIASDEEIIANKRNSHNGLSCEPSVGELPCEQSISDNINHPPHYNNNHVKCECGRTIECIDITRHHTFNIGNAIKHLWRCDFKEMNMEDLRKAKWYIEDEIKERLKNV